MNSFLPIDKRDLVARGWDDLDFLLITGDAYVDHPSFGAAVISRVLESEGYRVGIIAQPDWRTAGGVTRLGRPKLAVLITAGNLDSMVNHYTSFKKHRRDDAYSPGGAAGLRPDRATIVYTSLARQAFKGIPIILGGIEASLRRFAHYDFWTNTVRRSILLDSKADLLVYGMAERAILEIAGALAAGVLISDITGIRGTAYRTSTVPDFGTANHGAALGVPAPRGKPTGNGATIMLPSFETASSDSHAFAEHTRLVYENADHITAAVLIEQTGNQFIVQNPPQPPQTTEEMDRVYGLPYARSTHPIYEKAGGVPALTEVKFSLISSRGCFGACNFCAIHLHQGRHISVRSHESLLSEAALLVRLPDFKGYIHDVGGPTANFRLAPCEKSLTAGFCTHRSCLAPEICPKCKPDHRDYLALLKKLRNLPGIKKVFIRSGLRYDYLLADKETGAAFLRELCENHISGQLKVAPEHVSEKVLRLMNKPSASVYMQFAARFNEANRKLGKKQFLLPYLLTGHPGSDQDAAQELKQFVRDTGFAPEQVQSFLPTPMTVSACMWHTGLDPRTMKPVYVPSSAAERRRQKEMLRRAFY